MTLVICVVGRESMWTLVDRRLTNQTKVIANDATKVISLQTSDARATLAYAGLGLTASGVEPSKWTVATLRCVNRALEDSLLCLASAMQRQMPRHLLALNGQAHLMHCYVVAAYVGMEARLYEVFLQLDDAEFPQSIVRPLEVPRTSGASKCPFYALQGSGRMAVANYRGWQPVIKKLISAYERGRISSSTVSSYLSTLCRHAAKHTQDGTVGEECIVVHMNRHGAKRGGGGVDVFDAVGGRVSDRSIPTVAAGWDVQALIGTILDPEVMPWLFSDSDEALPITNEEELRRRLDALPVVPDEELR